MCTFVDPLLLLVPYMDIKRAGLILSLVLLWLSAFADDSIRSHRPRVGVVLSGGGAKGFAHIGVLKVLEEVGMPVDYIGGTSMGSIVGGLYALGYTAHQLEDYVLHQDWNSLIMDNVLRKNIEIYEKGESKKYWLQFPISGGKLNLPKGLLSGQQVSNLFAELASPAYNQTDFSRFRIPFLCIATDITTGEEVLLEHGQLSDAMRASMAIPTVFTPEEIDGKMLFDGGLVNNFPADRVQEKGIDILIGVDVTAQMHDVTLDNLYLIMEQVVFMASLPLKEANKKLCRVLVVPEIAEYKAASFGAADSLIVRGERAARSHYPALKMLADSLNRLESPHIQPAADCPQPLPSFYVRNININGLVNTSKQYVLKKSELKTNTVLTFDELNKAIDRLKGTQVFASVVYRLHPVQDDGTDAIDLHLDFIEHGVNLFRVGLHYDKEYKAALLLNLSFRNVLLSNSRALVDLSIGENPFFLLSYFQSPNVQPFAKTVFKSTVSPDWIFQMNGYKRDFSDYDGTQQTGLFECMDLVSSLKMQITPSVNSMVGFGVIGDYSTINAKFSKDTKSDYMFLSYQFFYERDTYNEDCFPTEGNFFHLEANYHKGLSKNVRFSDMLLGALLRSNFAASPTSRWTIHSGVDAGTVFGHEAPLQFRVYAGGLADKLHRYEFRFTGINFMQRRANNLVAIHFNHQIRLWSNIYVTLRTDFGKMDDDFIELFTPKNFLLGYGVSAQYNSVVGPLGFTLSSSNVTKSLLGAIHVGFWF
jgi:NTE family protein